MFYRSTIANLQEDGSVEAIRLYFDTDKSNTYAILQNDYVTQEKIEELLNLGDLIWLGRYIGSENPIGRAAGCTLIISRFRSPFSDTSYIGTLGPTRQSYRDVMNLVAQAGQQLEEVLYE